MRSRIHRGFCTLLVFACFCASPALCADTSPITPPALQGAWKSTDGQDLVRFQPDRMLQYSDHHLKIRGVVRSEPGRLVLRSAGVLEPWKIATQGSTLKIDQGGKTRVYERLTTTPPELELEPVAIESSHTKLTPEEMEDIRKELGERAKQDQAVRSDPSQSSKMGEVDASNDAYIRALAKKVGWIDVDRFGPRTSVNAFLLVQHSGDLPLMMAALPFIESDARRFPDFAQPYTLLYDRVELNLGQKQRYGTQIHTDAAGNPEVLPLEDPAHVDDFLKELKLPPLSEYLATASKYLYDNKPIKIPQGDQ
jgi:hypothetical protein